MDHWQVKTSKEHPRIPKKKKLINNKLK